eukprot:TRINITY_DN4331_c0_g1_i9.p1 TRINITY_DN4331_c0_g1~~TRINITY_DN4331_c0_g1_i9.p1  ORF type:complete len:1378 (+),score=193.08 TRINITY_DN4331_c0_g1_i9:484-4617(+)
MDEVVRFNQKTLQQRYIKSWFLFDLFAQLPYDLIALIVGSEYLPFLRIPRLIKVARLYYYADKWEMEWKALGSYFRIWLLFFTLMLTSHWISCIWWSVGKFSQNGIDPTWIDDRGFTSDNLYTQYIASLYWSILVLTTVGFGDIVATNDNERIVTICTMLVGTFFYSLLFGNIASVLSTLDAASSRLLHRASLLRKYMSYHRLPEDLKNRIQQYFDVTWTRERGLDEQSILNDLPTALRSEIAVYIHRELVNKVGFFQAISNAGFINSLVLKLKPQIALPGEVIVREGDLPAEMFFLSKGSVEVATNGSTLCILHEGSYFGEVSLIFQERRTASVTAREHTELLVLTKVDFESSVQYFPEFATMIRDIAKERKSLTTFHSDADLMENYFKKSREPAKESSSEETTGSKGERIITAVELYQQQRRRSITLAQSMRTVAGRRGSSISFREDSPLPPEPEPDSSKTQSLDGPGESSPFSRRMSASLSTLARPGVLRRLSIGSFGSSIPADVPQNMSEEDRAIYEIAAAAVAAQAAKSTTDSQPQDNVDGSGNDAPLPEPAASSTSPLPSQPADQKVPIQSQIAQRDVLRKRASIASSANRLESNVEVANESDGCVSSPHTTSSASIQNSATSIVLSNEPRAASPQDEMRSTVSSSALPGSVPVDGSNTSLPISQDQTQGIQLNRDLQEQGVIQRTSRSKSNELTPDSAFSHRGSIQINRNKVARMSIASVEEFKAEPTIPDQNDRSFNGSSELLVANSVPAHEVKPSKLIVYHDSKFKLVLVSLSAVCITYNLWVIPLRIGFAQDLGWEFMPIDYLTDFIFICEIIANFHTTYLNDDGVRIQDVKLTRQQYYQTHFFFDIFTLFPLDFIAIYTGVQYLGFLRIPRLFKIYRLLDYAKLTEQRLQINPSIFRIIKLFGFFLLFAHTTGCLWYVIPDIVHHTYDWRTCYEIKDRSLKTRYISSLYLAATTICTVGFGDIYSTTNSERVFLIIVMLIGSGVYSTVFGSMVTLVSTMNADAQANRQKLSNLEEYMKLRFLPDDIRQRIRTFHDIIWSRHRGLDEASILGQLPPALRSEVAQYLYRHTLSEVSLFQGSEASGLINSIVLMLRPQMALPGEYIIRQGEVGEEMYIVQTGQVEVVRDGKLIAKIGPNSIFGEISLIFSQKRTASVLAAEYSELLMLTKTDLQQLLRIFPEFSKSLNLAAKDRLKEINVALESKSQASSLGTQAWGKVRKNFRAVLATAAKDRVRGLAGLAPQQQAGFSSIAEKSPDLRSSSHPLISSQNNGILNSNSELSHTSADREPRTKSSPSKSIAPGDDGSSERVSPQRSPVPATESKSSAVGGVSLFQSANEDEDKSRAADGKKTRLNRQRDAPRERTKVFD